VRPMDPVETPRVAEPPEPLLRVRVMRVAADHLDPDPTSTDPPGLALPLRDPPSSVDHDAVPGVLAAWTQDAAAARPARDRARQPGWSGGELRVLPVGGVAGPWDGRCPKWTTRAWLRYARAGVAQLVERLICNQEGVGWSPPSGSFSPASTVTASRFAGGASG